MSNYEEGCYGDGSFGPDHTRRKVFEIALSEGFNPNEYEKKIMENDIEYLDFWAQKNDLDMLQLCVIVLQELEDDCIDFLNEYCSDDTYYWGYENGDFGYWRIVENV